MNLASVDKLFAANVANLAGSFTFMIYDELTCKSRFSIVELVIYFILRRWIKYLNGCCLSLKAHCKEYFRSTSVAACGIQLRNKHEISFNYYFTDVLSGINASCSGTYR